MSTGVELAVVMWELGVLLSALAARGLAHRVEDAVVGEQVEPKQWAGTVVGETVDGRPIQLEQDQRGGFTVSPGILTQEEEGALKQEYAVEKVTQEATNKGYTIAEQEVLPDQSIRLVLRKWE